MTAFSGLDLDLCGLRPCRHGLMLYLKADTFIGRALETYGEFSESQNRIMMPLVQPGDVVVDAGANVGAVTLALARRVGAGGRVIAIEPQRIIFQILCANVVLNGLTMVEAYWAAAGAKAGSTQIPSLDPARPANFGGVSIGDSTAGERVNLLAIDDLALPKCSLIKIDVEGMEGDVLRGAAETIAAHRPLIYLEAKRGAKSQACFAWLRRRGYGVRQHFAPFFERDNFRGVPTDIFRLRDRNALATPVPTKKATVTRLPQTRI